MKLLYRLMLLVALILAPIAAVEVYNWHALRTMREAETRDAARSILVSIGAEQQRLADGVRHTLAAVAVLAAEAVRDPEACARLVGQLEIERQDWLEIRVTDADGVVRCATDASEGLFLGGRPNVARVLRYGGFAVGEYTDGVTGEVIGGRPHLPFGYRWWSEDGSTGAATALVDADWIEETLASRVLPPNAVLKLADRNGRVVARVPRLRGGREARLADEFVPLLEGGDGGVVEAAGDDGVLRVIAYAPADAEPLRGVFLSVGIDKAQAMAPLDAAAARAFALLAATFLLALLGAWWGGNAFIRRPAAALAAAARRWRDGDRGARVRLSGRSELGELGRAFDEMAEAIATSEDRYRAVFESATDAMLVADEEGAIVAFNPAAEAVFGYGAAEIIGAKVMALMPEEDRAVQEERIRQQAMSGRDGIVRIGREVVGLRRDGSRFPAEASIAAWRSGGRRFFTAILRDLTERRRAEAARRASEARFRLVFEHAPVGIERIGRDGRILEVNRRLCEMLGRSEREIVGHHCEEFTHPEDRAASRARLGRLLSGEIDSVAAEKRYLRPDGSFVWVRATSSLVPGDGDRGEEHRITVIEDITERRAAEEAMRKAKERAEQADRAKTRFLASASHDLRQPMQSLLLFAAALDPHVRDEAARAHFAQLERGLDAMKGLIDGLLDVSRLDAGIVPVQVSDFPLDRLLGEVRDFFGPVAAGKGLALTVEACPRAVRSDPTLLGRMLRNLVENAVRYTERGHVAVACRAAGERLRIEVRDTGVGMAQGDLERIWDEFQQMHNPERDRAKGLGLGLAIVRRLSRLLDHPVTVRSTPGEGTVFAIDVPLGTDAPAPPDTPGIPPAPAPGPGRGGRERLAVVVDDDAIVLLGLQSILAEREYEVLIAGDPDAVVERVREAGRVPDVILADYRLRDGRVGTEAILRLREAAGRDIPAVILTGEIGPEPQRDAARLGLGLIHKPVTPRQLTAALERQILADA